MSMMMVAVTQWTLPIPGWGPLTWSVLAGHRRNSPGLSSALDLALSPFCALTVAPTGEYLSLQW